MRKKVVFGVLAHTDPIHLNRLCHKLTDIECGIVVHIDGKCDALEYQRMCDAVSGVGEVVLVENRIRVYWAGISMVMAEYGIIKKALDSFGRFSHLILLSGSCYPIKPLRKLEGLVRGNERVSFIKYFDMRVDSGYRRHIYQRWFREPWFFCPKKDGYLGRCEYILRRVFDCFRIPSSWPRNVIPYFGSQWWALTYEACEYVVSFLESNPWFLEVNRWTFSPDEHFFHTIIGNSSIRHLASGEQEFQGRGTWRMANLHLIHPSLSKVYTIDDIEEVCRSDRYFVRKVWTENSGSLLDFLDERVLKV